MVTDGLHQSLRLFHRGKVAALFEAPVVLEVVGIFDPGLRGTNDLARKDRRSGGNFDAEIARRKFTRAHGLAVQMDR